MIRQSDDRAPGLDRHLPTAAVAVAAARPIRTAGACARNPGPEFHPSDLGSAERTPETSRFPARPAQVGPPCAWHDARGDSTWPPTARRIEVRASPKRRAHYLSAAARRHLSLSEWARRHLDDAAAANPTADLPPEPSPADVAAALQARGALRGSELRARLRALRDTPWQ